MNLLMHTKSNTNILVDAVVVGVELHEEVQSYPQIYREKDLVVKDCSRTTMEKVNLCNIFHQSYQLISNAFQFKNV